MKNLFLLLSAMFVFTLTSVQSLENKDSAGIYYYYNFEDTYNGSTIIVYANSQEEAHLLITDELTYWGLTFEPTNIIEVRNLNADTEGFVIFSETGDL